MKKTFLDRLNANATIIGDGGMAVALEKRGYVQAGPWTPECVIQYPDAVKQLHREFARSGADVLRAFNYFGKEDHFERNCGYSTRAYSVDEINEAACRLAKDVACEFGVFAAGTIKQTNILSKERNEHSDDIQQQFKRLIDIFQRYQMDLIIIEHISYLEEAHWAVEQAKQLSQLPIAVTMSLGPSGDANGVSAAKCAQKLARAGADLIGVNCHIDPALSLKSLVDMQAGLDLAGLSAHLICQPTGVFTPDGGGTEGIEKLPEYPFALEPRACTRWDMTRFARNAFEMGVRYIGGCCHFEPYHIRAIAEELLYERGKLPLASANMHLCEKYYSSHSADWMRQRATKDYWMELNPCHGRPESAAMMPVALK